MKYLNESGFCSSSTIQFIFSVFISAKSICSLKVLDDLILSLHDRKDFGINKFSPKYNKGYFEANETDEVCDYSPCFFGVGSVTYDCDSEINLSTGEILQQGEKIDNMEDFYGCVDEDKTWVIGCRV